jgi:hypothetical protein
MKPDVSKWLQKIKNREAHCYIKPNRKVHDSGFRCFEVGYMELGKGNKVKDKLVLGEYSDHIMTSYTDKIDWISMDLTLDGYIRLWDFKDKPIHWEYDTAYSSATLEHF